MSFDTIGQRLASTESGTHNGRDYTVFYLYYYPAVRERLSHCYIAS